MAVPQELSEPRQIGQFRGAADTPRGVGCPIGIQQIIQVKIGRRVRLVDPAEQVTLQVQQYLTDHPDVKRQLAKQTERLQKSALKQQEVLV